MLDMDLDLEADLGIDTVKQAEMFAAIRAAYDIARDDALKLRDFPTLAHAVQFVFDRRPDLKPARAEAAAASSLSPGAAAASIGDAVKDTVLAIISEKTGYPQDMLDLDLDLEADLGIDTVKQAEMFAAIRSAYDIPRDDALKLRDFPTLAHAIQFVYDRRPDLRRAGPMDRPLTAEPAAPPEAPAAVIPPAAVPRRIPIPQLRPPLRLCKSTGVAIGEGSRLLVMMDRGGVGKALVGRLEKMGAEVLAVDDAPAAESLVRRIEEWKSRGSFQGVFWLPALDPEAPLSEMNLQTWREATHIRVKLLFASMRALYDQIGGTGTFLVSAVRLGGAHGYDATGALAPLGGCVSGFTKAFKREKPEALVKTVDFEASRKTSALADLLIEETLLDPGAVEVGYREGQRWTVGLEERGAEDGGSGLTLGRDTVFLVTGAAGSIVSAITADLAAASGGTFHLLDLAPEPDPAHPDLLRFASDKEGLRRSIFERLKAEGARATPALVEKEMAAIERFHAAATAIQAIRNAGGTAHYYQVNLLDGTAVSEVLKAIHRADGRVDVLIHAAGLEISHLLPDKSPKEFDLVFDVKADGWFNLIANLGATPLEAAVVFSSVAGRFGNVGQTDYSAANDLLCKCVSSFRNSRPQVRGIAIDWTAWSGIGMAARGSIPEIMKQAGIDMLPPEAGIPVVRRELTAGGFSGEVVIAGRLGIMVKETDPSGGLDLSHPGALEGILGERGIMTGRVLGASICDGVAVEVDLEPCRQPFLFDHQIGGTPVLPGVMGIEALAQAARLIFPDRCIHSIEEVQFHSPFKFYRGQPRTLKLLASHRTDGDSIVAQCRLIGSRVLHGHTEPEITTHFTARVRLTSDAPEGPRRAVITVPAAKLVSARDLYRLYFHGPAYQVIESAWRDGDEVFGLFAAGLPPNHEPAEAATLVAPRLIELCFQTAGIWELSAEGRMGLPHRVRRIQFFQPSESTQGRIFCVVAANPGGGFDARVVDEQGHVRLVVEGYGTMALPESVDPDLLRPLQDAIG